MRHPAFRKALLVPALLLISGPLWAAAPTQRDWWYTLERGRALFASGDYGGALLAFEDARRDRRATFDRMERAFVELLSTPEFRRLGDSLDGVETRIRERGFADARAILDELYFRIPRERFGDSVSAALEALGTLRDFPEAEMWIGRTFLATGELTLALRQFRLALSQGELLEAPALSAEILYEIAGIHRIREEYTEMERALLSIVEGGGALWTGAGQGWQAGTFARDAMTRTLQSNGIERFLSLYRYGDSGVMRAHRDLGLFYAASGRHARAQEHLMFAFLIQNTIIIDEIIRRDYDFGFTTLDALADEIDRDPTLSAYARDNAYHRVAFYLANSLFANASAASALGIWGFLAGRSGIGEWQARAANQLRSPQIAPATVAP